MVWTGDRLCWTGIAEPGKWTTCQSPWRYHPAYRTHELGAWLHLKPASPRPKGADGECGSNACGRCNAVYCGVWLRRAHDKHSRTAAIGGDALPDRRWFAGRLQCLWLPAAPRATSAGNQLRLRQSGCRGRAGHYSGRRTHYSDRGAGDAGYPVWRRVGDVGEGTQPGLIEKLKQVRMRFSVHTSYFPTLKRKCAISPS